jgi:DNA (cytosine-5)-methyltransferase 1
MAYVEIEAYIIANLVAGMEAGVLDPAPIWTDAKTFDASPFRGRIHGIVGGYPCTPFSLAGTRSGEEHPGHIYPSISRAIEAARPIWCLFENVAAHLTLGFDKVYQDLQRMGYAVEAGIYTAEEVGAPHERERLFILAVANSFSGTSWLQEYRNCRQERKSDYKPKCTLVRQENRSISSEGVGTGGKKVDDANLSEGRQNLTAGDQRNGDDTGREETAGGFESSGKESLANFIGKGLEGFRLRTGGTEQELSMPSGIGYTQFPARPGEQQNDWEEPRTIKSGLGCTVNGYNFREDLLRALGNSVVEQTAELAFIDLLNKHLKHL